MSDETQAPLDDEYLSSLTELERTAVMCGLTDDPLLLSEFELHQFIRQANKQVETSNTVDKIHMWSGFEMFGMPTDETAQEELAKEIFKVDTYHIHNQEDDRYFIVRHTTANSVGDIGLYKLNPTVEGDRKQMDELVSMLLQGFKIGVDT